MKVRVLVTAVAALACVVAATAQGLKTKNPPLTNAWWQKGYDRLEMIFNKKDLGTLHQAMAPSFTMTSMGKTENHTQAMASVKEWFAMAKSIKTMFKVNKVTRSGDTIKVWNTYTFETVSKMDPKDKTMHTMKSAGKGVDTWVWKRGQWWLLSVVNTDEKVTMDGKPMKMPG